MMKKNLRILSFLIICFILFLFIFLTPKLSMQFVPQQSVLEEPTLSLGDEVRRPSSEVIIVKTPLHLTSPSNASEKDALSAQSDSSFIPPVSTAESTPSSTPAPAETSTPDVPSTSEAAPAPATPSTPEVSPAPETSSTKEIPQGGYPESHLWEKQNSTIIPASESGEIGASTSSNSTSYSQEDIFSESFLAESPMTEKGKPGNGFRSISQNGGLDVIPRSAGINGRSIYGPRTHIIEDGDSLEYLALRYLGDSTRTDEIFEANRTILPSKEELPIGTELIIPERF